jgi:mercuric ion transport protein
MGNEQAGRTLFAVGVIGTIVAALCCFTPILMVLLGAVGLAAVVGWLDLVLLPALIAFVLITGYALWQRQTATRR